MHVLKLVEILRIEAGGDDARVHTDSKTLMLREMIHSMEGKLSTHSFQRIHRSSIVEIDSVQALKSLDSGEEDVINESGVKQSLVEAIVRNFLKLKADSW